MRQGINVIIRLKSNVYLLFVDNVKTYPGNTHRGEQDFTSFETLSNRQGLKTVLVSHYLGINNVSVPDIG